MIPGLPSLPPLNLSASSEAQSKITGAVNTGNAGIGRPRTSGKEYIIFAAIAVSVLAVGYYFAVR